MVVTTFISYAEKDKKIAGKLKEKLSQDDFDVFLSHEDISIGSHWLDDLQCKIKNCEIFLVVLSQNFHDANFTNHEVGFAIACNKRIFAVSIDGKEPYGFMESYQTQNISPEINDDDADNLSHDLLLYADKGTKIVDEDIDDLRKAMNYRDANTAARNLKRHSFYTKKQINEIAEIYFSNSEVSDAWTSRPFCEQLLNDNKSKLNIKYKDKLN